MAALEKRYPRESFTKKLERICQRLDEASARAIAHKDFYDKAAISQVEITSLWVVGSYARGAMTCGDMDLVLEYKLVEGHHPPHRTLTKTFFGSPQYVRYYFGTPESSTAGVEFSNAIQIWTGPGCDWKASIDSIKSDPGAGRAERETDSIPLRPEQLYMDPERLAQLVALEKDGILEWEFVEITPADLKPIPEEEAGERDRKLLRMASTIGKKSQALIPAIIRLLRKHEPLGTCDSTHSDRGQICCGSTALYLGRPAVPYRLFDDRPAIKQFALLPHISGKGPNGAWLIRRGPNHPDVQALAGRQVYYVRRDNCVDITCYSKPSTYWTTDVMELFGTAEEAAEYVERWYDEEEMEGTEIFKAEGSEIFALFGLADVIEVDEHQLAMTHTGSAYLERDKVTMNEIAAALPLAKDVNAGA